jgi:hypothetical protein
MILNSGIFSINQFFRVGPKGFSREFRTISEVKATPQSSPLYYSNLDNRNLRIYISFLVGLRPE